MFSSRRPFRQDQANCELSSHHPVTCGATPPPTQEGGEISGAVSLELDVAVLDDLHPRGDVAGDDARELLGRGVRGLPAVGAQLLLDVGLLEYARERLVESRDD